MFLCIPILGFLKLSKQFFLNVNSGWLGKITGGETRIGICCWGQMVEVYIWGQLLELEAGLVYLGAAVKTLQHSEVMNLCSASLRLGVLAL